MCGFGLSSFCVGHGGGYREAVWFGARWVLECRAILRDVFGSRRYETTQIVSGLDLVVWYLEEDREERLVHLRHVIVGWFCGDVSESVGGLYYHRQNIVGSHYFERIRRIGLGGNRSRYRGQDCLGCALCCLTVFPIELLG